MSCLLALQAFEIKALIPLQSLLIQKIQPSPFARRLLEVKINPQLKNLFLSYKPLTCFILSSSLKGGVHSQIGKFIHVEVTNISITSKPQKNSDKNRIKQKKLTAQDWQLDSLKVRNQVVSTWAFFPNSSSGSIGEDPQH